jgi:hypothetical protein
LILKLPENRVVHYSIAPRGIERTVRRAEEIEHREHFRLTFAQSQWSIDSTGDRALISLHLRNDSPRGMAIANSPDGIVLQAAVGGAVSGKKENMP